MNNWEILLRQYLKELTDSGGYASSTISAYTLQLGRFVGQVSYSIPIECTRSDIVNGCRNVLAVHRDSYNGDGSKLLLINSVKAFIGWCANCGQAPRIPFKKKEIGKIGSGVRTKAISRSEMEHFLETIRNSEAVKKKG